jgi:hypothetical protein
MLGSRNCGENEADEHDDHPGEDDQVPDERQQFEGFVRQKVRRDIEGHPGGDGGGTDSDDRPVRPHHRRSFC